MKPLELSVIIKFVEAAHAVNTQTDYLVSVNVSDNSLLVMVFESKTRINDIYFKHICTHESAEAFEKALNVLINIAQGGGFDERSIETTQHKNGTTPV
jgi:hypothetical protein